MNSVLNEKKEVIIPLISLLQKYNPQIGSYDRSVSNASHYQIKLSNGYINLSKLVVADFESNQAFMTDDQLSYTAYALPQNPHLHIQQNNY